MPFRSRTVKAETQCFMAESVDVLAKYISFFMISICNNVEGKITES